MTFIPYQVDYAVKNTAKTLGFSKKRVSFKFGFANPQSVSQGLTGAQCRGSEHEVTFMWSLASGKRQLFLDGKDVHYSESGMNGWTSDRAWQHSFPLREMASGRTYKIHFISQPVNKDIPDMKAFDLRINGVSYFSFNEIWKLGTPAMITREGPRAYSGGPRGSGDAGISPEERRLIAMAKAESLKDMERQKAQQHRPQLQQPPQGETKPMVREEQALISFDDPPPPQQIAPVTSVGSGPPAQQNQYSQFASPVTLDSAIDNRGYAGGSYGQPPPPPNPYGGGPSYAPYPPAGDASASTAMTPYTAGPAPSPYAQPQPVQTYGYGSTNSNAAVNGFQSMTSPSQQSYASYGSAPSFAKPPPAPAAANPYGTPGYAGYPPATQPAPAGYPAYPPQQQQQPPPQPPQPQQQQYPPQQQQQYPPQQQQQQQPYYGYPNQQAY